MELVAFNITNLTDARYFAAKGANYIVYNTNQISGIEIAAINAWVDIPNPVLQFENNADLETIWTMVDQTGIKKVVLKASDLTMELADALPEISWSIYQDMNDVFPDLDVLPDLDVVFLMNIKSAVDLEKYDKRIFFELDENYNPGFKKVEENNIGGLIIRGSAEEKTGIKTYDEIDDILEEYTELIFA